MASKKKASTKKRDRKAKDAAAAPKDTYGTKIMALPALEKQFVRTGDIIKAVKAPARAARRVLRALVAARKLKMVKVERECWFVKYGVKADVPAAPEKKPKAAAKKKAATKKTAAPKKAAKTKKPKADGKRTSTPASAPSAAQDVVDAAKATVDTGAGTAPAADTGAPAGADPLLS